MKCPFCKEEILDDAIKCRFCGSMLSGTENISNTTKPSGGNEKYTDYSQVPWFRKNWFAILCFFIFTPALFLVLVTGDVYYKKKGQLITYGKVAKNFSLVWCVFTFIYLAVAAFQNKSDQSQVSSNLPQGTSNPSQVSSPSESESAMGTAPQAGNSALQPQQGTYFRWVSPPGWRVVNEIKNGITLTSPDGIYVVEYFYITWTVGANSTTTPMTPQTFLQTYYQQLSQARAIQNYSILSLKNLPDQGNLQRIEGIVSSTLNNVPRTGKSTVGVTMANGYGSGQVCYISSYSAANDKLQDAEPFLSQIANSIVLTNAAGNNPSPVPNNPSNSDDIMRHWQSQTNIRDNSARRYDNTIPGRVDLLGPHGERTQTWNQGKYKWRERGTGRIVQTDTYQSPGSDYEPMNPY